MKVNRSLVIPMVALLVAILACIPPQDCELITRDIAGQVQDQNGNPVSGATVKLDSIEHDFGKSGIVDRTLVTDNEGYFKQKVSVFRCDSVKFVVSKEGFIEYSVTYGIDPDMAMNSGWMPTNLVIALTKAT
jgi:hypothetical protein